MKGLQKLGLPLRRSDVYPVILKKMFFICLFMMKQTWSAVWSCIHSVHSLPMIPTLTANAGFLHITDSCSLCLAKMLTIDVKFDALTTNNSASSCKQTRCRIWQWMQIHLQHCQTNPVVNQPRFSLVLHLNLDLK